MKIGETLQNYKRVLQLAKKADKEDLINTIRICGVGIGLVGFIGFLFYLVSILVGGL